MKVFVYFNLHRKLWSVKALSGESKGRVIGHFHHVGVRRATFKVSEAGRQRVIREQRKNVHAGVKGELVWTDKENYTSGIVLGHKVTYNPYKFNTFVDKETLRPVHHAAEVWMDATNRNVYYFHC